MVEEKPCCAASAVKKIRKIMIDGQEIGIAQLDEILTKVSAMNLGSEEAIGQALMKQVRVHNYVPRSKEQEYRNAIMNEYARRKSMGDKIEVLWPV